MDKFIKKLETENYEIGSFDAFIDESSKLITDKQNITGEEVVEYLKQMPTTYRASIVDKDGNYVGFIGVKNVDAKNEKADIVFMTFDDVNCSDKNEILEVYKNYLYECINIKKYDQKPKKEKSNIIRSKYITPGIDEKTLSIYKEMYPDMPKLALPVTLSMNGIVFGVIGLTNLIRTNKRADLKIYLSKDMVHFNAEFIAKLIDDYLSYAHKDNIWSINYEIGAGQSTLVSALNESNMSYYGTVPFGDIDLVLAGNLLMFQHTPQILTNKLAIQNEVYVDKRIFDTNRDEMSDMILLDDGYKMIRPDLIEDEKLFKSVLKDFSKAMSNRDNFTIPLGDDKYFPQIGNEKYGLYKALKNYSYIVLDKNDNFIGFINILRQDKYKKHCEIEVAIVPEKQGQGIGTIVTNRFYEELFALGYASVTSKVFGFNKKSQALFDQISEYNGQRIQSYYVNGRLWDMNVYTKLNPLVEKVKIR